MQEVSIYISISNASPKALRRRYGYVLSCDIGGSTYTKEYFGEKEATRYQVILTAMGEALNHLTKPCQVKIYPEDPFITTMANRLEKWAEAGWKNRQGKPIANVREWKMIYNHKKTRRIECLQGKHAFSDWLTDQMSKNGAVYSNYA